MNGALFHWVNRWPEWLAPTMRFFSEAANYGWFRVALLILVVAMLWRGGAARRGAVQALLAFPLANEITDVFKKSLPMPRPFQVEEVILRAGASESMGTASAHSANMMAVAFVFTYHLGWRFGAPWILIAFLTGLSRIYNGVHYPYQVVLGWACGAFAGLVITKTWEAYLRVKGRKAATSVPSEG